VNKRPPVFAAAFPFVGARQRFFEPGEVRLAILSLLAEGPKHGYQLMKEMQDFSGGLYTASAGSVYPTLQQLEDEKMVIAESRSGRRVYHITKAGRKEAASDPDTLKRMWDRAKACEDWGQAMSPESIWIWGPLGMLIKASMRAAGRAGIDRVREILDGARRELEDL
jgi:DNA-binding PadR family transcriptional regulator